jgi:hypothetical protein
MTMGRKKKVTTMKKKFIEFACVDLGAAHNGRIAQRCIFEQADGTRVIVDKGVSVPVLSVARKPRKGELAYVTVGRG